MADADRILTVTFKSTQDAEDLFYCKETKKVYARQPANVDDIVFWYTTRKWTGGYEADCPIREGVTMRVVDKFGEMLFEEKLEKDDGNGGTSAKKNGEFKREAIRRICNDVMTTNNLSDYEEWKKWLCSDMKSFGYEGYSDNWMYWDTEDVESRIAEKVNVLGLKLKIMVTKARHKISGKEWVSYEIWDKEEEECEGVCGYKLL